MSNQIPSLDTRQRRRQARRRAIWDSMSGFNCLSDDKGFIPRAVRRDMMLRKASRPEVKVESQANPTER